MGRLDAIHVRYATPEDVETLIGFDPVAQAGDEDRMDSIRAHVANGLVLVAETAAGVSGYALTIPGHLFGRDFVELLIVDTAQRRRGVGSALLEAAVGDATSRRVFTSTNLSNAPMKALLASSGWAHSGTLDGLDPGDPEEFYYIDR